MSFVIPDPLIIHTVQGVGALSLQSGNGSGGTSSIVLGDTYALLRAPSIIALGTQISLTVGDQPAWTAILESSVAKMGFFGAAPIAQPSVTGVTTQDQVDALVDALAGLGLVTDDR
jgi:hypothetical protein